jgi:hypothetical protein
MELYTISDKKQIETPLDEHYPRTLVDNAQIASYHREQLDAPSFTLFPKLSSEICLKIWQCAISVPRIIKVEFDIHWPYSDTKR